MPMHSHCLTGVTLIPDPGIAIVVVPPSLGPFRKAHSGGGHHAPGTTGQTAQHRHCHLGVSRREDAAFEGRDGRVPRSLGGRPTFVRIGQLSVQVAIAQLQNEVECLAGLELQLGHQWSRAMATSAADAGPPKRDGIRAPGPSAIAGAVSVLHQIQSRNRHVRPERLGHEPDHRGLESDGGS